MPDPLASPRRRWLRVSLRGLMLLVVLIALPAGWVANTVRTQRQAIRTVREAGGTITFDYQRDQVGTNARGRPVYRTEPAAPAWLRRWLGDELFQDVRSVRFTDPVPPATLAAVGRFAGLVSYTSPGTGVGDGFRQLWGLRRLEEVWVAGPGISDAMLGDLAAISSIHSLTISRPLNPLEAYGTDVTSPVTDAGLARLVALRHLESLGIAFCPDLTDAGLARLIAGLPPLRSLDLKGLPKALGRTLAALARHHPDLGSLHLDQTGVTDEDLKAVEALTKLRSVGLQSTAIGDAGVAHLLPLRELTGLLLSSSNVGDEGLVGLGKLPNLAGLYLGKTRITDAGLGHLVGLSRLRALSIGSNDITDAAMPAVARLTNLEELELNRMPRLTDAALVPLRALTKLRRLTVVNTPVTPGGVAALQQAIPTLTRVYSKPTRPAAPRPAAKSSDRGTAGGPRPGP